MSNARVIFRTRDGACFELPLVEVLLKLDSNRWVIPHDWADVLQQNARGCASVIEWRNRDGQIQTWDQPPPMVADLIGAGQGTAFCPRCDRTIQATEVAIRNASEGANSVSVKLRRLSCFAGHEIGVVIDAVFTP